MALSKQINEPYRHSGISFCSKIGDLFIELFYRKNPHAAFRNYHTGLTSGV